MKLITADDKNFSVKWQELWKLDYEQNPFYQEKALEYIKEYFKEKKFINKSFIIQKEEEPIIGLMITINNENDCIKLSSYGRPLLCIQSPKAKKNDLKKANILLKQMIDALIKDKKEIKLIYEEKMSDITGIKLLTKYFLGKAKDLETNFKLEIDLRQTEDEIKYNLRKSYKSLVNWGIKNMVYREVDFTNVQKKDVNSLKELHKLDAGKVTRSDLTWDLQLEMIKKGEAYIILGYLNEKLVSAGLFLYSARTCYYSVSASMRNQIKEPVMHGLIYNSIIKAKKLGCKRYLIGEHPFNYQNNKTNKEVAIGHFKAGFGANLVPYITFNRM